MQPDELRMMMEGQLSLLSPEDRQKARARFSGELRQAQMEGRLREALASHVLEAQRLAEESASDDAERAA